MRFTALVPLKVTLLDSATVFTCNGNQHTTHIAICTFTQMHRHTHTHTHTHTIAPISIYNSEKS